MEWFYLAYIALFVIWEAVKPKPELEAAEPLGLGDVTVPTATEGRVVPIIFGEVQIAGPNCVGRHDFVQEAITQSVQVSLFQDEDQVIGFRYYLGLQMALCMGSLDGPDDGMTRHWIDDKLVFDSSSSPVAHGAEWSVVQPELFGGEELGSGGVIGTFEFFAGLPNQAVSSYLDQFQRVPEGGPFAPAYRDICYYAPSISYGPTYWGTRPNIRPPKTELRRYPNGLGLTGGIHIVRRGANPANVLYELMTHQEWGRGIAPSRIDVPLFTAAAQTLFVEGNGYSFVWDRAEDITEHISRVEQQIDGILRLNPFTEMWEIKLIRDDYDVLAVPEINATNLKSLGTYTIGLWEGTSNDVRVPYADADDGYKQTFGHDKDMASRRVLGREVSAQVSHPGCKNGELANELASRELRLLSVPIAQAEFTTDRSLFGVLEGDVVALTSERFNLVRAPMRVKSVDYGNALSGELKLACVRDNFRAAAGQFEPNPQTRWEPQADDLQPIPPAQQVAIEAPYGLTRRASNAPAVTDRIMVSARRQGPEVSAQVIQRSSPGVPTGAYHGSGEVFGFQLIGNLAMDTPISSSQPQPNILVSPGPDTQSAIEAAFPTIPDTSQLGDELNTLCLVGSEFLLVSDAQTSGGDVALQNVYRGVLDTPQQDHLAGEPVYLVFRGMAVTDVSAPAGENVDVKLLPRSTSGSVDEVDATAISFTMSNRTRRPYPPSSAWLNGTVLDRSAVILAGSGAGEDIGILVDNIIRRDYRTYNEIQGILTDAGTLDPTFPGLDSTEVIVQILDGASLAHEEAGIVGTSVTMRQFDILAGLDITSLPASLVISLLEEHTFDGVVRQSLLPLTWDFTVSSPLVGRFAFGLRTMNVISALYTVQAGQDSTNHTFTLSSAFTVGDVQFNINGGGFNTLINAGTTSGLILASSLTVGDTIGIRHVSTDAGFQKQITMDVAGTIEAYGIFEP